jgi:hypothetical protein
MPIRRRGAVPQTAVGPTSIFDADARPPTIDDDRLDLQAFPRGLAADSRRGPIRRG